MMQPILRITDTMKSLVATAIKITRALSKGHWNIAKAKT